MIRLPLTALTIALFASPSISASNIDVVFTESAPKDRFAITNSSECTIKKIQLEIDLTESAGNLIFDTTSAGAGVEVYQAFESQQANLSLVSHASVNDGDTTLTVQVDDLKPFETASFTIDVDDQLVNGELGMIRVSNSEIAGTSARVAINGEAALQGLFETGNRASIKWAGCADKTG